MYLLSEGFCCPLLRRFSSLAAAMFMTLAALPVWTAETQAQQTVPTGETYTWSAKFVSFDQATNTITAEARLVGDAVSAAGRFKAGDRVTLRWSGYDVSADAVRDVTPYTASPKNTFAFPVELALPAEQKDYVGFKFRVSPDVASGAKGLKSGDWMRVVSRHRPSSEMNAFVRVMPFASS